jgi:hypothetical protein
MEDDLLDILGRWVFLPFESPPERKKAVSGGASAEAQVGLVSPEEM